PDPGPPLQAATAASEIAFLQAQSTATKQDAEKSLDIALTFVDATAPTLTVALERHNEVEKLGTVGFRNHVKSELKKKTDNEARLTANNIKSKLEQIVKASQQRFDIETQMMSRLRGAGVGL